jgi:voltage-gated potassium channel
MKSPLARLRAGLLTLAAILVAAVAGYRWIGGWSLLDSVYMVVTTLAMVGYREMGEMTPALKLFTIAFIVFGLSTALYIMGGFVQMMAEGEINRALGLRRVTREIERLRDHVIVCGFGRTGEILAHELHQQKRTFVVVDKDADQVAAATVAGYLTLNDDATEEDALLVAGVTRAKVLVTTLPSDADNVFITLTARNLNRDLQIIARGELRTTEKKLLQAGADRVVLPAAAAALRMAAIITRPSTIELIELAAGRHTAEVQIDELTIPAQSSLVGRSIRQSEARAKYGLLIVAVRRADGNLIFNPDVDTRFEVGDAVIAMGREDGLERMRSEHGM